MGKILFTRYMNRLCAMYLSNNRLLAVYAMSEEANRIGAVYIGKIKNVVKNIDACFLEIAGGEICFLSNKDAVAPVLFNRRYDGRLLEGDEILVQLSREAQKNKLASVSANISLSNEYAALSIGSSRIGYSGKLSKPRKAEISTWLTNAGLQRENNFACSAFNAELSFCAPVGLVIRTKTADCTEETLLQNIRSLTDSFWNMINTAQHRTCFSCIKQAPADFETVFDQLVYPYEYDEIITDHIALYETLCVYCRKMLPDKSVRLYEDSNLSLSKLYSLESKMETAFDKRVWLKSGGYLIIEYTEALTIIDVNTGKYEAKRASKGSKFSQSAYEKINYEAAEEIALQLRLRNLSGIILIDFINLDTKEQEEQLLKHLRELVQRDKMKTLVVDITPLGLVEITRKKRHKPLWEQFKKN